MNSSFTESLMTMAFFTAGVSETKGFKQAKADGPVVRRQTFWLALPAGLESPGRHLSRWLSDRCAGDRPARCLFGGLLYTNCRWSDWVWIKAIGDEWGRGGARRRRGFGSLHSPVRNMLLGGRNMYIPAWVTDFSVKDPGELWCFDLWFYKEEIAWCNS